MVLRNLPLVPINSAGEIFGISKAFRVSILCCFTTNSLKKMQQKAGVNRDDFVRFAGTSVSTLVAS